MKSMLKIFSIASLLATSAFCATSWVPPVGSNQCTSAGAFMVKALQYFPSTTGTGQIQVFFAEYPNTTFFEYDYNGTSATAVEQANAMLSLLETAKATGTKISMYITNPTCGIPISGGSAKYYFSMVNMDTYP